MHENSSEFHKQWEGELQKKKMIDNYDINLLAINIDEGRRKTLFLPCKTYKAQESDPIPQITNWFTRDPWHSFDKDSSMGWQFKVAPNMKLSLIIKIQ